MKKRMLAEETHKIMPVLHTCLKEMAQGIGMKCKKMSHPTERVVICSAVQYPYQGIMPL